LLSTEHKSGKHFMHILTRTFPSSKHVQLIFDKTQCLFNSCQCLVLPLEYLMRLTACKKVSDAHNRCEIKYNASTNLCRREFINDLKSGGNRIYLVSEDW